MNIKFEIDVNVKLMGMDDLIRAISTQKLTLDDVAALGGCLGKLRHLANRLNRTDELTPLAK